MHHSINFNQPGAVCCLKLASIGLPNEEGYRRELREFLFTAPGVADCISGVVRAPLNSCCCLGPPLCYMLSKLS